jgi:hypothetical protein
MSLPARLGWHSLVALLAPLAACGDNLSPATDAGLDADAASIDGAVIDAAPALDADTTDAGPTPDARAGLSCALPFEISPGESHLGDTTNHSDQTRASCSPGSGNANDATYHLVLPAEPVDVIATVSVDESVSSPYDAVLSLRKSCTTPDSELGCADIGFSDRLEVLAVQDEAYLLVDGTSQFGGQSEGGYQLDLRTRSIVGEGGSCDLDLLSSRCASGLRCSSGQCVTDSADLACADSRSLPLGVIVHDATHAFEPDFRQGSCAFDPDSGSPERSFALHLDTSSDLTIRSDVGNTAIDTVIYLLSACDGTELGCADDIDAAGGIFQSRLELSAVPAGDYIVVVDGASASTGTGPFGLLVTASPVP